MRWLRHWVLLMGYTEINKMNIALNIRKRITNKQAIHLSYFRNGYFSGFSVSDCDRLLTARRQYNVEEMQQGQRLVLLSDR